VTTVAPYGAWASPVDAARTISELTGFSQVRVAGGRVHWLEQRPGEGGRQVVVEETEGDLVPPSVNVRSSVHEYGGGDFLLTPTGLIFSSFDDQRLYRLDPGSEPVPLTPEPQRARSLRYADGRVIGDEIICVRESHPAEGEPSNELVVIPLDGSGEPLVVVSGKDFVSNPRPSPDGSRIAWLAWDHPRMPWDGCELWVAAWEGGELKEPSLIAGGPTSAVVQPEWGPDGSLYFIDDPSGWWNLYRWDRRGTRPVFEGPFELGYPQWALGGSSFAFLSGGRIAFAFYDQGRHRLGVLEPGKGMQAIDSDYTRYASVASDGDDRILFVASHPRRPSRVVELSATDGSERTIRANRELVEPDYVPVPKPITFPTSAGEIAHGFFYPPTNPDYRGPEGELAPLRVEIHGGPTAATHPGLTMDFLYWTSRGIGVVDLNYRGSTGYGRAYRERLRGNWGVVDVEDAVAAARYLAGEGLADPNRLTITGGSAGGYTTLQALSTYQDFAVGSSYFGIADLELLDQSTHKFESSYLDGLVGSDQAKHERSPINHLDGFRRPVILFQGLEDKVVPPEQARMIAAALQAKRVRHSLVTYPGEGHGFRKAATIVHSLEAELAFFGQVLGFVPQV
jgi:dipeptidyl aminopeptidase/acylaminoacyl peptidase